MVSVPSADFIYSYISTNQNVTNWAVTFDSQTSPVNNIQYQVWYNSTRTSDDADIFSLELLSFMRGMDEAIFSALNDPTANVMGTFNVGIKDWPLVHCKLIRFLHRSCRIRLFSVSVQSSSFAP